MEAVRAINAFATGGLQADRTLLLRIQPQTGRDRQDLRAEAPDRLELENEDFFAAIATAYDVLAAGEPRRVRVIDAAAEVGPVLAEALVAIDDLLPGRGD